MAQEKTHEVLCEACRLCRIPDCNSCPIWGEDCEEDDEGDND